MQILPNLIAFVIGLGAAWFLKWKTTDLVWSLWLSSLVVGYLTILATIGSGVAVGLKVLRQDEFPKEKKMLVILGGAGFGLFTLAFFSIHFCGFHAGHATFLESFFPVDGMPEHDFFGAFVNPFKLWKIAFTYLFPLYGIFLISAIIVERKHLLAPFKIMLREEQNPDNKAEGIKAFIKGRDSRNRKPVDHPMARPYLNVIRMHLLIFFFAGVHVMKIDSFLVYAVVYAVYFFPWRDFFKKTSP